MTANHEHTPTPAAFRRALESMASKHFVTAIVREYFLAEYDRMIAQVEAAAEQRGAARALREAADEFAPEWPDKPDLSATRGVSQTRKWLRNRADRMEDDDA